MSEHEVIQLASSEDEEHSDTDSTPLLPFAATIPSAKSLPQRTVLIVILWVGLGWTLAMYVAYPFPTTIPIFVGLALIVTGLVTESILRLGIDLLYRKQSLTCILRTYSISRRILMAGGLALVIYWLCLGFKLPVEPVPSLPDKGRIFIAANLHNNEEVLSHWSDEVIKLALNLGQDKAFISIYESNSVDRTKELLGTLGDSLTSLNISHRIVTEQNQSDRRWPYGTSPERIDYLAAARNRAMEPLQNDSETLRLYNWAEYDKVVFLNDIWFEWQDVYRLLGLRDGDFDLACGVDFGASGLYDTWVARDVCGTPMRPFWPYVKDEETREKVKKEEPFEVAACWNGVVAFDAKPFLYTENRTVEKRSWRMIDNSTYPSSKQSPELTLPIRFRSSHIDACDHSECFLFSYDLHRYTAKLGRRPKIFMNPKVKVAYEEEWWKWNTRVLRIPFIKSWRDHWSHGLPLKIVDGLWEYLARRRDVCTWAGLQLPPRCPPLPGPKDTNWDQ